MNVDCDNFAGLLGILDHLLTNGFLCFYREAQKSTHSEKESEKGKKKWGVAFYKQDYPETELEDIVRLHLGYMCVVW